MGNVCYLWFEVVSLNKEILQKIFDELSDIGYNGCYGFRDIKLTDDKLEAIGETKWSPPIDMFEKWLNDYPEIQFKSFYKEEFLHFAGTLTNTTNEHVDFKNVCSYDVREATEGLLYELNNRFNLADHMDNERMNDYQDNNEELLSKRKDKRSNQK